jgi:PncC family amidohydrolase
VESSIDPLLRELRERFPEVQVGIYPSYGSVSVLLQSAQAEQLLAFKQACEKHFALHLFSTESGKIEEAVQSWFIQHKKRLALAESCTGGAIAQQLVSVPGASDYFLGSFVTYSDALKMRALGVSQNTLKTHGAVSAACVKEMLAGVFHNPEPDFAIAVTGVAGPTAASSSIPVGTVWAAIGERGHEPEVGELWIPGSRLKIIQTAANCLLGALWRKAACQIPAFPFPIYSR